MTFKLGGILSVLAGAIKVLNWLISIPIFRSFRKRTRLVLDSSIKYDRLAVPGRMHIPAQHLRMSTDLYMACIHLEPSPEPESITAHLNRFLSEESLGSIQKVIPEPWPPLPSHPHATMADEEPKGWRLLILTTQQVPKNQLNELIGTFDTLENLSEAVDRRVERSAHAAYILATVSLVLIFAAWLTPHAGQATLLPLISGSFVSVLIWADWLFIREAHSKLRCLALRGL